MPYLSNCGLTSNAIAHNHTRVVVNAKEVNWDGDDFSITFKHRWRSDVEIGKKIVGIASTKDWVEKPAIAEGIRTFDRK